MPKNISNGEQPWSHWSWILSHVLPTVPVPNGDGSLIRQGTLEIVIEEVSWSIRRYHQTIWSSLPRMFNDILSLMIYNDNPPPIRLYTKLWPYYLTRHFTKLWEVSIGHLRRMWHADGTLTPPDTWLRPIWDFHMFYLLRQILIPNLYFYRTMHSEFSILHGTKNNFNMNDYEIEFNLSQILFHLGEFSWFYYLSIIKFKMG